MGIFHHCLFVSVSAAIALCNAAVAADAKISVSSQASSDITPNSAPPELDLNNPPRNKDSLSVDARTVLPHTIKSPLSQTTNELRENTNPKTLVPTNLDPNPNPLLFPTKPSEVQIQRTQPITLQEAIALAQRNNRQLQAAQLQLKIFRDAVREQQGSLFPTLTLNGSITRSLSASGQISVENQELELNEQTIPQLNSQINTAQTNLQLLQQSPSPDPTTDPLGAITRQFQITEAQSQLAEAQSSLATSQTSLSELRNFGSTTLSANLTLDYAIYTSGRRKASISAAEETLRFNELEIERFLEELRLNVANAYYDLQQADEQIRIEEAAVRESARSLSDAEQRLAAGLATRLDVLNAQVQLDNAQQRLRQSQSRRQIARRQLAQILNLPKTVDISAADPVAEAGSWNLSQEESIVLALKNRAELEQQLIQRNISKAQQRAILANLGPQLSFSASYQLLRSDTDEAGRFTGRGQADGYSLGLSASWLLFDGGQIRARAEQEKTRGELAEINFADRSNQVRLEVERSYSDLQSNLDNIAVATRALTRAREALDIARLRFQAGVGTQTDVLIAETALTQAEGSRVQAILGYNRALASLQRAVSNLPRNAGVTP